MGKIYPVSTKYLIKAEISASGAINKNDVVGAIFGQTEGLLGTELELRELQKGGRIGRIEVNVKETDGKAKGEIRVPSSMDKAETAIIGAALETIERVGPCDAKIKVKEIEDVRLNKRESILKRAKSLLKKMVGDETSDTQEITNEVKKSVRASAIIEYGPEKLAASSDIATIEEIIIVEGRADVVNMLRYGFTGIISLNGANVPKTVKSMLKTKTSTLFVDGDRGGDIIIKEMIRVGELDFVAIAPDGKEVEELTSKEIHKCLRNKKSAKDYFKPRGRRTTSRDRAPTRTRTSTRGRTPTRTSTRGTSKFKSMFNDLFGTRGAYLLDKEMNILGKVPSLELKNTLEDLSEVHAVVLDGVIDKELVKIAESKKIKYLVGSEAKATSSSVEIIQL